MVAIKKVPGLLDLNALSGRYLLVTLVLGVAVTSLVGWTGYVLDQATSAATESLRLRNRIQQLSVDIRGAVWQSNFALQAYMISPSDDARERALGAMREAQAKAAQLSELHSAAKYTSRGGGDLDKMLGTLYLQLGRLMEIRENPDQLHPAMHLMADTMLPTSDAFLTAINAALSELSDEHGDRMVSHEYRLLGRIRDRWRQMIGAYRVMVANRFGAFSATRASLDKQSEDVEVFYSQIASDLDQVEALRKDNKLSFQAAAVLGEMRAQTARWYAYFHKVREMYATDSWRTDLPFLRDIIQPLFDAVWHALLAIEAAVEDTSNHQVAHLRVAGARIGTVFWVLAASLFALLILGYAVLDRTLLAPIARLSRVLSSDIDVETKHSGDVPVSRTREIRQLVTAFEKMRAKVQQRRLALEYQSLHDSLTGLPNRACLLQELDEQLLAAADGGRQVGLMIMDLDHFKEINDTLGHPVGDLVLQEVAKRLADVIANGGLTARLGGDEFAVVLPAADHRRCADIASAIAGALEREFQVGGHRLYVGGSAGVALFPDHGTEVSVLMRHADVAMYMAKHMGRQTAFYDDSEDRNSVLRLQLVKELKDAIAHDRLALWYQPKLDLERGTVGSVEALLRWDHPEHGMVPPDRIVPMAEQTGVIQKLTQWVLRRALEQLASWRCAGIDVGVAVNLSTHDLQDSSLPDMVGRLLTATGTAPEKLTLEITESAMMRDLARATVLLSQIKRMGVGIAIDDFGTGFSSLSYLKSLPVRELKIDRSFVSNMNRDESDAMIVHSTIDLAHNLGLRVVAEGVENEEIMHKLRAQGCDLIQGYHLCRPLPPEQLQSWLSERRGMQEPPLPPVLPALAK